MLWAEEVEVVVAVAEELFLLLLLECFQSQEKCFFFSETLIHNLSNLITFEGFQAKMSVKIISPGFP